MDRNELWKRLWPIPTFALFWTACHSLSIPPAPVQPGPAANNPFIAPIFQEEEPGTVEEAPPEEKVFLLDDITVTATRTERRTFDTPRAVTIVDQEELAHRNQHSVLDTLNDKIGVWVEKRTYTTSDPVIRGFSGGNLLALVDGNSLTTLWGEGGFAGDDMYGKVDGESIERVEVIRGPTSVLYGSNALGGVINFITKASPIDYTEEGFDWGGLSKIAYSSSANEFRARQEFFGASERFKFFIGGTSHNADDMEGGRGVGTERPTGGRDYSYDFKSQWKITDNQELELAVQDMHRHKTHRYYKPNQDNFNDREAVELTWKGTNMSRYMDEIKVSGYFQYKRDKRRDFDNEMTGYAKTRTYAVDLQSVKLIGENHRLTWGLHYHEDHGESPDDEQFTWTFWDGTGTYSPAPESVWNDFGLYLQDEWDLSDRWTLIASGRYDQFHFNSNVGQDYVNYFIIGPGSVTPGFDPYSDEYTDSEGAFSGGLGLLYRLTENINLIGNYAHGYRQFGPKFGITEHGAFGYLAPHPFLDPVESDTVELGAKALYEKFAGSFFTYYSGINNWQTNVQGSYNGLPYFDANGNGIQDPGEEIFVTTSGKANVYGVELETETRLDLFHRDLPPTWSVAAGFGWNYGNDRANDEPIRHTHPARGILALRWKDEDPKRKGWFEVSADMVRHYDRIPSDRLESDVGYKSEPQDKTSSLVRDDGLPGYTVYNVRGGLDIMKNVSLTAAVENLTDKAYRRAHSRLKSESGINFLVGLTYRF